MPALGNGSTLSTVSTRELNEGGSMQYEMRQTLESTVLQVPAVDYGLQILDILRAPEKDLNQVVGMKRLAPYREDTGRFRPNMAKLMEMQVCILSCEVRMMLACLTQ